MNNLQKGNLLLSEPFMWDPNFKRSVILLTEHNEEGSVGFILNKKIEADLAELIPDFPVTDVPVYFGGPVQNDTLHYIHHEGDKLEGSLQIGENLYWGGNFETLKVLIKTGEIDAGSLRFFVGYSGWAPSQLEYELKAKSWIIGPKIATEIFDNPPEKLWRNVLKNMGEKYAILANYPEDPSLN